MNRGLCEKRGGGGGEKRDGGMAAEADEARGGGGFKESDVRGHRDFSSFCAYEYVYIRVYVYE